MSKAKSKGSLAEALSIIKSGDVIATPCYGNEPQSFLSELHTATEHLKDVKLWLGNTMKSYPVANLPELAGHVDFIATFYGKDGRTAHGDKRISIIPSNLSAVGMTMVEAGRPNVFVAAVSPADSAGNVHMSLDLEFGMECMEVADTIIFEINDRIPVTCGDTAIPLSKASCWYEVSYELPYAPQVRSTPVEEAIAGYVASLVNDGDCIQLGIGGTPNAVGKALMTKHDLGIHTEMITSTMGELIRAGVVTNERKNFYPGITVGAFAWGDQALYDELANNDKFLFRRSSWTNDPFVISQNDNMVSINTAMQIDLTGQICSESIGSRQYSGSGGASDFAYGAFRSKGGKGIVAINSTAKGGTVSKIQPVLSSGAAVTISRNISDYIVTEYGIAKMRDRTVRQRVDALIAIAHPDFRSELKQQADRLMLW